MENYIYEICAVLATLIFIVVGVYLVMVLKTLIKSLKRINSTLSKIDMEIEPLSNETIRLLENSNEIAESIQDKLTDLDPLMGSISNVGSALRNATSSFDKDEGQFKFFHTEKKTDWQSIAGDLINLAAQGIAAWQKIKKGR